MRVAAVLVLLFLFFSRESNAKLLVSEILPDGRKNVLINSDEKGTEGFLSLPQGYKIFGGYFLFDSNLNNKWEVLSKDDGIDLLSSPEGSYVLTGIEGNGRLHIRDQNNREKKFLIQWSPNVKRIVSSNCGSEVPKFILKDKALSNKNILFASYCSRQNKNLYITVSTTSDVEWANSTIFETDGKGERWRHYQVPSWVQGGGTIGGLKLKKDESEIVYLLKAPKSQEQKKRDEIKRVQEESVRHFENEFIVGTDSLDFTADSVSSSDSQISIAYRFTSPRFFNFMKFGGYIQTSLGTSTKENSLTFTEALLYGGYSSTMLEKWEVNANLAFQYADFQQKSTSASLQSSQLGVLLGSAYLFNANNKIRLEIYKTSFSSAIVKDQLGFSLSFHTNISSYISGTWLGIFFKSQKILANNEAGLERTFNESLLGASFVF